MFDRVLNTPSSPSQGLQLVQGKPLESVAATGFEPATTWFVIKHSTI